MNAEHSNLPAQFIRARHLSLAFARSVEFPLLLLAALPLFFRNALPPWAFMWLIACSIFMACKWLTWRRSETKTAPAWKIWAWFLAWPGLDAKSFFETPSDATPRKYAGMRDHPSRSSRRKEALTLPPPFQGVIRSPQIWLAALLKTLLGAALLWGIVRMLPASSGLLAGWCGLVGLVLLLHFGIFHLLALAWQSVGVDVQPLMNAPAKSASLGEFWGRRWNSAFNQLVHGLLFRPLRRPLGVAGATLFVFLLSGLIHELVISVPARAGYGLPTTYFLLQGAGVLLERSPAGRALHLRHGLAGWCFTMAFVALPVFWLFHPPFVLRVILPFLRVIRAL